MEERPRNLRSMLAEAKDLSELMVDLAYASVYFGEHEMASEVSDLEERMSDLVHDMRAVCVKAARNPRDAEGMSSVLQVVSAIERIANDAVDIARIVTHQLGIPAALVADLFAAAEVSHRVEVGEGSRMDNCPVSALELPVAMACASWPSAGAGNGSPTWTAIRSCCLPTPFSCAAPPLGSPGCVNSPGIRSGNLRRRRSPPG